MPADLIAGDGHVMDAALIDLRQQFAEGDVASDRALVALIEQHGQSDGEQRDNREYHEGLVIQFHHDLRRTVLPAAGRLPHRRRVSLL